MDNQDIFLIPTNGKITESDAIKEWAHVSFPNSDQQPVLVASINELTHQLIIDYLKSIGLVFNNYRITCYTKK